MGIVQEGDAVLRARAKEVPPELISTTAFQELIDVMVTTMREAPGVGLAAPQIGVPLRVIVLEDTATLMRFLSTSERATRGRLEFPLQVIVNPMLRFPAERKARFLEGCLSVEGMQAEVERYLEVEVDGLDRNGKPRERWRANGWPARILQHEVDHLDGTLYIDRMVPGTAVDQAALGKRAREGMLMALRDAGFELK
jgi:peptide deformylase